MSLKLQYNTSPIQSILKWGPIASRYKQNIVKMRENYLLLEVSRGARSCQKFLKLKNRENEACGEAHLTFFVPAHGATLKILIHCHIWIFSTKIAENYRNVHIFVKVWGWFHMPRFFQKMYTCLKTVFCTKRMCARCPSA